MPLAQPAEADGRAVGNPGLDGFAEAVRQALDVPLALVSLVHSDRQEFPGLSGGLPDPYASNRATPLTHSFCRYVVHDRRPLIIRDARTDHRLRQNPAIGELGVVAYAGHPLTADDGTVVGSLCAIDHEPRAWTTCELTTLTELAHACQDALRRSLRQRRADDRPESGPASGERTGPQPPQQTLVQRSRLLLALSEALAETLDVVDVAHAVTTAATSQNGCLRAGLWLRQTEITASSGAAADPSVLRWVRQDGDEWLRAADFDSILLDEQTPVGLAAIRSESLYFRSRAEQNACFPRLAHARQEGERRAFTPLIHRGRLLGTLALVWPDAGAVPHEQRLTVDALASYTAQALERASLRRGRDQALTALQQTLMPTLPPIEDLELAARYVPASTHEPIGGDWYEASTRAAGSLDVTIGDVVGHDVGAAPAMGQLRTMLRVLTTTEASAATRVTSLDRAVAELDVAAMASLVHGTLRRIEGEDSWEFRWTNAGHLPPLAVDPDGCVRFLERRAEGLIGTGHEGHRSEHAEVMPSGTTLLLFTDGLVKRRGELLQTGLDRLRAAARRHVHRHIDDMLDRMVHDQLVGQHDDDVALLGVRLTPPSEPPS